LLLRRLTVQGFRIESRSDSRLSLTGPGTSGKPRNPLRLISKLDVRADGGNLSATVEIAGHRGLFVGLYIMICVMSVGFCVMAFAISDHQPKHHQPIWAKIWPLSFAVVWAILLPSMYRLNIAMTRKWLDWLLRECASNGEAK